MRLIKDFHYKFVRYSYYPINNIWINTNVKGRVFEINKLFLINTNLA